MEYFRYSLCTPFSRLDHQNICTIYEIDDSDDGQTYISMAYYGTETLKSMIAKEKLPVEKSIDIAVQIARGLVKTHSKGIIHRDIKPANILLPEDGAAKIIAGRSINCLQSNATIELTLRIIGANIPSSKAKYSELIPPINWM